MSLNRKYLLLTEKKEKQRALLNKTKSRYNKYCFYKERNKVKFSLREENVNVLLSYFFNINISLFIFCLIFIGTPLIFNISPDSLLNFSGHWMLAFISPFFNEIVMLYGQFLENLTQEPSRFITLCCIIWVFSYFYLGMWFDNNINKQQRNYLYKKIKKNPTLKFEHFKRKKQYIKDYKFYQEALNDYHKICKEIESFEKNIEFKKENLALEYSKMIIDDTIKDDSEFILNNLKEYFDKKDIERIKNIKLKRKIYN